MTDGKIVAMLDGHTQYEPAPPNVRRRDPWKGKLYQPPLASSRARAARFATARSGAALAVAAGPVDVCSAVRGPGVGLPAARCFAQRRAPPRRE